MLQWLTSSAIFPPLFEKLTLRLVASRGKLQKCADLDECTTPVSQALPNLEAVERYGCFNVAGADADVSKSASDKKNESVLDLCSPNDTQLSALQHTSTRLFHDFEYYANLSRHRMHALKVDSSLASPQTSPSTSSALLVAEQIGTRTGDGGDFLLLR